MEYFFSTKIIGKYERIVDELLALKLGKIIGEDYSKITLFYQSNPVCKEAYDLLSCGILVRGTDVIKIESDNEEMVRFVTRRSLSDKGILIIYKDDKFYISIFNSDGKEIGEKEAKEINYLLNSKLNFNLSKKIGTVINGDKYIEEYQYYISERKMLND